MIFRAQVVWFSAAEGQIHMTYQTFQLEQTSGTSNLAGQYMHLHADYM